MDSKHLDVHQNHADNIEKILQEHQFVQQTVTECPKQQSYISFGEGHYLLRGTDAQFEPLQKALDNYAFEHNLNFEPLRAQYKYRAFRKPYSDLDNND